MYLAQAIEMSRRALVDHGKTPFGAMVVIGDAVVGEGTSSVVELHDATAHAEVMALREAGRTVGRHLMPDAVMYSSSEPCPMCLMACYWAQVPRLVFGATSYDVGTYGFEDLQFYRDLTLPAGQRLLVGQTDDGQLRAEAADVLRLWAQALPYPVEPKL
jgi:guanine deaminase